MDLDTKINLREKLKTPRDNTKRIFWQPSIKEQRPKLRVRVDNVYIQGLVDTGADVSIITPQSWHPRWPLQSRYSVSGYWNIIESETEFKMA